MPEITPVALIRTPYSSKFGIPRQSGTQETEGRIELNPPYRSPDAVRGLEGFSHLWLIWGFHEAKYNGASLTVRPPRLGGNVRMGVFATRSPYRPNGLGLSCVRLLRIETDCPRAPVLVVQGADMLDKTPIYDIKPYLSFSDSVPEAVDGFAAAVRADRLNVTFSNACGELTAETRRSIETLLREDPRPHYQNDPARIYAFEFSGMHITFICDGETLLVKEVSQAHDPASDPAGL